MTPAAPPPEPPPVVIDTNRVLDLWLFGDPEVAPLRQAIEAGRLHWMAQPAMRVELARVLTYPAVARQLLRHRRGADAVLAAFDRWVQRVPAAPPAPVRCRDPDDQIFIDLAVTWRARLLSRDRQIITLARRLTPLGVTVEA